MAATELNTAPVGPQPLPERDYRGTLPPELRGEVLAWNLIAACNYWPHMERIIRKLEALLAAADALRDAAAEANAQ